jgi:hypothetical protein
MNPKRTAILWVLAAGAALADEVQLANGARITGIVSRKTASEVVVEVGAGTLTFRSAEVSAINPGRTPLHEFKERREALRGSGSAEDRHALAAWAKEQGLHRHVAGLCYEAIELDPEHAGARSLLRHEKRDGKWLTFEQAQEARGLRWIGQRWATEAEVELQRQRRLEADEKRKAAQEARARRADEERERRAQALAEAQARMDAVMGQLDGYFYSPSFAFTTPYFRPYWHAPYLRSRRYYQEGWMYGGFGGFGNGGLFGLGGMLPGVGVAGPFTKKK